jgi:hypothetical protein
MNETSSHRRKGKIAALSKELRDFVNQQLDDGVTYAVIAEELQKRGASVNAENLSNWKEGGYQDYLRDQAWRERLDQNANRYLEVGLTDGTKLAAGGLYAASVQICKLIDELANPNASETDPDKCSRVTNALSRLSRSILQLQQYRDAIEKAKATELKQLDPDRELRDRETLAIVDEVNRLFGLRQYRKPRIAPAQGTDDRACQAEVPPSSSSVPLPDAVNTCRPESLA